MPFPQLFAKLVSFSLLLLAFQVSRAQNFEYGAAGTADLRLQKYSADSTADAVVLDEFGESMISNEAHIPLIFTYHVKIKLFNSRAFPVANVIIPLRLGSGDFYESVTEITGYTLSTSKGQLKRTELDPKLIYHEKKNSSLELVKFTLPNLTEGCIIEYTYKIKSTFLDNFRSWTFQSQIPKIRSVYVAHIPAVFNYNVSLRGPLKLTSTKAELEEGCFDPGGGTKADCSKMTYTMAPVPAFKEEEYMTAASNFLSAINFDLSDYKDNVGITHKVAADWKNIDQELKLDGDFGGQIKKGEVFKDKLNAIRATTKDSLTLAKAIYRMIQQSIHWNGYYQVVSEAGIKKAVENRSGGIADINLSLAAALIESGFTTRAVLLSTRENGFVNTLFPAISNFNYVIAAVDIGSTTYLLDASDPLLPFGLLPVRCINDQGRAFSLNKPSYWISLTASQKESRIVTIDLDLKENGKISGTVTCYSRGYEALNKRLAIKSFSSPEEYAENLDEKMPKVKILKASFENIDSLENTLSEKYEVEISAYNDLGNNGFLFNPFFLSAQKTNPFKLKEREYPVDWGAPSDYRTTLTLTVPEGYFLEGLPPESALSLPLNGGRYRTSFAMDDRKYVFSELILLDKPVYGPEEYPYLKELFNRIVKIQNTDLIFRKKP